MDFIMDLPTSGVQLGPCGGGPALQECHCHFCTQGMFCSANWSFILQACGVLGLALFHREWSRHRFTGHFWTKLFKLMGSELNFSTSLHPHSDEQTERVNALLELYLRHYLSANQWDWAKLFDVVQFLYNLQKSKSTGRSLFKIITGQQPLTSSPLTTGYKGLSPPTYKFAKDLNDQVGVVCVYFEKAS